MNVTSMPLGTLKDMYAIGEDRSNVVKRTIPMDQVQNDNHVLHNLSNSSPPFLRGIESMGLGKLLDPPRLPEK
jgi:hypothetical protein